MSARVDYLGLAKAVWSKNGSEDASHLDESSTVEWVMASEMFVPDEYQRPVKKAMVKKIVADYEASRFGVLELSLRGSGRYAVIDGQQRLTAVREKGWGERRLRSIVHRGLDVADEARLFWMMNSAAGRMPLTTEEVFRGRLEGKDDAALEMKRLVEESGFSLAVGAQDPNAGNVIEAIGALNTIYGGSKEHGPQDLATVLRVVRDAWQGEQGSVKGMLLLGVHRFHTRYRGGYDRARLLSVLRATSPSRVLADGTEEARILGVGNASGIGQNIARRYNHRLTKNRLPEWNAR